MGLGGGAAPCRGGSIAGKKAEHPQTPFPGEQPLSPLAGAACWLPVQCPGTSEVRLPRAAKERSSSRLKVLQPRRSALTFVLHRGATGAGEGEKLPITPEPDHSGTQASAERFIWTTTAAAPTRPSQQLSLL